MYDIYQLDNAKAGHYEIGCTVAIALPLPDLVVFSAVGGFEESLSLALSFAFGLCELWRKNFAVEFLDYTRRQATLLWSATKMRPSGPRR